jgi:hypothetical protein
VGLERRDPSRRPRRSRPTATPASTCAPRLQLSGVERENSLAPVLMLGPPARQSEQPARPQQPLGGRELACRDRPLQGATDVLPLARSNTAAAATWRDVRNSASARSATSR